MDSAAREVISCIAAKFQTNIGPSLVFDQDLDETIFETVTDPTENTSDCFDASTESSDHEVGKEEEDIGLSGPSKRSRRAPSTSTKLCFNDTIVIDDESDNEIEVIRVLHSTKGKPSPTEAVEVIDITDDGEASAPTKVVQIDLDKEEAILSAELLSQTSQKGLKQKPFISNYFKPAESVTQKRQTVCKVKTMPKFPCLPVVDSIFSCGAFGNYAARYQNRRSFEDPAKKFVVQNVTSYRNLAFSARPSTFIDSLSYHSQLHHGIPLRVWAQIQKPPNEISHVIRVCSYNVLCQPTIDRTLYLYRHIDRSRETSLEWPSRWCLMSNELKMLQADVFCLQEVYYEHYTANFLPFLEQLGYVGRYQRKTGGTMDVVDGCAIFYRKAVFEEVCYRPVLMYAREESVLDKPNIGQVIRLRHRSSNREICVANTHLIYNTKSGHRKFAQLALLLANLREVCNYEDPSRQGPLQRPEYVLCGDFNLEPFSDIYRFIIEKQLNLHQCKQKEMSGQGERDTVIGVLMEPPKETRLKADCTFAKEGEKYSLLDGLWTHEFDFASSYFHLKTENQHDCSNLNRQGFNPDFIFYSVQQAYVNDNDNTIQVLEGGLRLLRRLELPEISEAMATVGPWPSKATPSDHIPLLVDFVLT